MVAARTVRAPRLPLRARTPKHSTRDLGGGPRVCLLVVGRLVEVDHRVERGVYGRQPEVGEQVVVAEAQHPAPVEQEGRLEPALGQQLVELDGQRGPVGGGQRLPVAVGHGQHHVMPSSRAPTTRRTNAGCRNGRSVEQQNATSARPASACSPTARPCMRAETLGLVVVDLDSAGSSGSGWPGGAHDHDRTVDAPCDHPDGSAQQRRPVPGQRALGRPSATSVRPRGPRPLPQPRGPEPTAAAAAAAGRSAGRCSTGARPSPRRRRPQGPPRGFQRVRASYLPRVLLGEAERLVTEAQELCRRRRSPWQGRPSGPPVGRGEQCRSGSRAAASLKHSPRTCPTGTPVRSGPGRIRPR